MRIITRYIVREHVAPLAFALTALTSLLLLQYVARQLDKLVGKGLPWSVIGEFLLLSLPFTIAMTLPMAVLVSTLHAFGRLSAENEITAFKASGVRVRTLMAPVLLIAAGLSVLMIGFNDQVLPRANHRLAMLLGDIVSVRPTVGLREQVLTAVTPTFYLKAGWIDPESNRMQDVEIYDLQNSAERRSIFADSGTFTMSADSLDMLLVLYEGEQLQFPEGDPRRLQRTFFGEQVLRVKDFAQGFSASSREGKFKSEREQGICELQAGYEQRAEEYERRRQRYIGQLQTRAASVERTDPGDTLLVVPRPRPVHRGLAAIYCDKIPALLRPATAEAAEPPKSAVLQDTILQDTALQDTALQDTTLQDTTRQDTAFANAQRRDSLLRDSLQRSAALTATDIPPGAAAGLLPGAVVDGIPPADSAALNAARQAAAMNAGAVTDSAPPSLPTGSAMFSVTKESLDIALREMNSYAVEVQKKFAISMACFVFVLFGPPIALRFPRGGVGVTIGVSLVVFGAYYVCLMAGEVLADKGALEPVIAMWTANVIFTVAGLVMLLQVEKSTDASRGGGIGEWWSNKRNVRALKRGPHSATASGVRA